MTSTKAGTLEQPARQRVRAVAHDMVCQNPDPLGVIVEEHALQLELCDLLESIADALPAHVNAVPARIAITILKNSWPAHVALEEECLFPTLLDNLPQDHASRKIVEQLCAEHDSDEDAVVEVVAALEQIIAGTAELESEALGYLLRGFFESQRRHIAWEDAVILPLARQTLTTKQLTEMQRWIMSSRQPWCVRQSLVNLKQADPETPTCCTCQNAAPAIERH